MTTTRATTPYALARAECSRMTPNGACLGAGEQAGLRGYSLPLPDWMPQQLWHELVEAAREAGENRICVRVRETAEGLAEIVPQTAEDRRQALALPVHERTIKLGRRYDFCFCPRCGERTGASGPCEACQRTAGGSHREPTARQYMANRPRAPRCSCCDELVPECSPKAEAVLCWRCTSVLAERRRAGLRARRGGDDAKLCPECGQALPLGTRRTGRCETCRRKHQRQAARARKRRQRRQAVGVSRF